MTKNDCIWVAIRIFGIYLVVLAVVTIPSIVQSSMALRVLSSLRTYDSSLTVGDDTPREVVPFIEMDRRMDRLGRQGLSAARSALVSGLVKILICGSVGIYLMRSGRLLFALVSKTDEEGSQNNSLQGPPAQRGRP